MKGAISPLDLTRVGTPSPRDATFRLRTARRTEGLRADNAFSAEVQMDVARTVQNAMNAGAPYAIVQTIRIDRQYTYVLNSATTSDDDVFAIRNLYSMLPLDAAHARVRLAAAPFELVQWLRSQELDVAICGVPLAKTHTDSARVAIEDWLQIVALFVPGSSSSSIFNARFVADKALDASAIPQWNRRLLRALDAGMPFFVNSVLNIGVDFGRATTANSLLAVSTPVRHPTMTPLDDPNPGWALSERYTVMCTWVSTVNFQWTLSAPSASSKWALFLVLLPPRSTYQ